jgi:hypothetical protein
VKAGSGVADLKAQAPATFMQVDGDGRLPTGVLERVLQRLQAYEVDGGLDIGRVTSKTLGIELGMKRRMGKRPMQGISEPALLQQSRLRAMYELAQVIERLLRLVGQLAEHVRPGGGLVCDTLGSEPEMDAQRDQSLLGAVVQIALQPAALLLAGPHGAQSRGAQLAQGGPTVGLEPSIRVCQAGGGVLADAREESPHDAS